MENARFWTSFGFALLAYAIARAADVPIWYWERGGDAIGIAAAAAFATYAFLGFVAKILSREAA
jgi:hypothetical protein